PLSHLFTLSDNRGVEGGEAASRGDFIVSCSGEAPELRLKLEEVVVEDAVDRQTVVLRPSLPLDEHERTFVVAYLQSDRAWRLYTAQGGTPDIDGEALGSLPVVLPTELVRLTLADIES